ncbi:2-deoxyribose-5-phosphate aldolase [Corynebacterium sp.]|uniref:2-deoxyribose-5-phosphate aldolase n=1 Tax=Corynebacterium sp. TaxID=1720 RepID=UPI002649215F|nr:2-deoxyribose-5-phosphate aldolase [Corynebacterium sp.]MDN5720295.1 2-deoxyribose-5-phosphate aldolase [Corynebacterium sp.]MDN6258772.1 2-deoxyribose-5-phosphate aldolase [Corynebacterium sp.]
MTDGFEASHVDPSRVELVMLDPASTRQDAARVTGQATAHGCAAVCLPPTLFPLRDVPEDLRLVAVAGYPSGKHHPLVKGSEAHMSIVNGAHEVHAVVDAANVVAADVNALISEIVTLREAVPYPATLQVAVGGPDTDLALDDDRILAFCRAAATAGADMVAVPHGWTAAAAQGAVPVKATGVRTAADAARALGTGARRVAVASDALGDVLGETPQA